MSGKLCHFPDWSQTVPISGAMQMKKLLSMGLLLVLASCASALRHDYHYDPAAGEALLIFEERHTPYGYSVAMLVEVNLENDEFLKHRINILQGRRNRVEIETQTGNSKFSIVRARPGNYAVVGMYSSDDVDTSLQCFAPITQIYELKPGMITIIPGLASKPDPRTGESKEDTASRNRQFLIAMHTRLAHFPRLTVDQIELALPLATIQFEGRKQFLGRGCPKGNTFTRIDLADLIAKANGSLPALEALLGLEPGALIKQIAAFEARNESDVEKTPADDPPMDQVKYGVSGLRMAV
jgi:hypothetical protein